MALLRNGVNRNQFRMKQENELKSLLTDQQFEASDNRELLLAQAKACANGAQPTNPVGRVYGR